jgi:TRAP-type C4-dicarboxylate transport system permease small subunit
MKALTTIVLVIIASLACLVAALFITWLVWEMQITERAFHCTDDGLSIAFWTSAETHEAAGDKILPGWTWEKLKAVNRIYEFAFFTLWIGGSVVAFRGIRSIMKDYMNALPNLVIDCKSS